MAALNRGKYSWGVSYAVHVQALRELPYSVSTEMKARQASKIRELADAVEAAGFLTLDEQAQVLGVPRSTAWTIRRASHKASGLSASIINRMLAAPKLPLPVRARSSNTLRKKLLACMAAIKGNAVGLPPGFHSRNCLRY